MARLVEKLILKKALRETEGQIMEDALCLGKLGRAATACERQNTFDKYATGLQYAPHLP